MNERMRSDVRHKQQEQDTATGSTEEGKEGGQEKCHGREEQAGCGVRKESQRLRLAMLVNVLIAGVTD